MKEETKKIYRQQEDLKFLIDDVSKTQSATENYIEKYLPLKIQNNILRNIKEVVPPNKYEQYHRFVD